MVSYLDFELITNVPLVYKSGYREALMTLMQSAFCVEVPDTQVWNLRDFFILLFFVKARSA